MEREGMFIQSIYYGQIGSEATERLLEIYGRDGSFLLRDSQTVQGTYCLCVRKAPFVHTYRLVHAADSWYLQQDSRNRLLRFETLELLIEHHRRATDSHVGVVPLNDPLEKRQIPDRFFQGLVYMEMNSSRSNSAE
ncbi:SH2 domain-containing protein 1A-like isoform X1 [Leuresthes tenuis]|uniref:SH2 domain-containing protein 1A-like isoform X1 n=1 Tax=Leuresthes tenuis TaxID=355514 RepID=UPI003B50CD61